MSPTPEEARLVLHIEVEGFNVAGVRDAMALADCELIDIVTEEWMREEVGLTLVSLPGEKCMNSDFEVHAMNGRIVGAHLSEDTP